MGLIRALPHLPARAKKRLRDHSLAERDALFVIGAGRCGYSLFVTINLKDGEQADDVLRNLRRAVEKAGHSLEYRGREVPAFGKHQRHLHVIINVQAGTPAHRAVEAFRMRRNKTKPRSMNVREITRSKGGIPWLIGYINGPRNGGDLIQSQGTRGWMEELGRRDLSAWKRGTFWPGPTPNDPPLFIVPA